MQIRFAALVCAVAATAGAQSFDVVSVKRNVSGRPNARATVVAGKFSATGYPLRLLLVRAYGLPANPSPRLSGVPDWVNSELYDIEAKADEFPTGLTPEEARARMQTMMQKLLVDAFHLSMRVDTKQMPVYALTVAPGGPKMPRVDGCPAEASDCHQFQGGIGRGLHAKAASTADLAGYIENWTDLPVVDRTGLAGLYAIETEPWQPISVPPPPPDNPAPSARPSGDGDLFDPARPTIFVVMRRLGLELKREMGPVKVYTVEHIGRPAAN